MTKDILRRCYFRPYAKGAGPTFALTMWDTHTRDHRGQTVIGYRLTETREHCGYYCTVTPSLSFEQGGRHTTGCKPTKRIALFEDEDFAGSPLHAIDSDDTVAALMGFLTLRPGDTDAEYFADYTPTQLDFAETHAEALAHEVERRFGERS